MSMKAKCKLKLFLSSESGAVTVEWVFLSAAAVSLTLLTFSIMKSATLEAATNTTTRMTPIGEEN